MSRYVLALVAALVLCLAVGGGAIARSTSDATVLSIPTRCC